MLYYCVVATGIGKYDFAVSLSHALLCRHPVESQKACGECASCQWLKEGVHPDFKLITPEDESSDSTKKKTSKKKTNISRTNSPAL